MTTLEALTAMNVEPIVQSDTTVYNPLFKAIVILAAGDLHIRNGKGVEVTRTFESAANGGAYPFILWSRVDKVFDTGTTLTDAQLLGLR